MENDTKKIVCPNCSSTVNFWDKKGQYDIYSCTNCKLVFVYPLPNPESVYGEDYFSGAKAGFGYVDYDKDKEPMIPVFNKYLDLFSKFGKNKGELFDIGAATGFFMNLARMRGYNVLGVEMSKHAVEIAEKKGLKVYEGDLMSLNLKEDSFDVVTMLDVLEHMTDPLGELIEVKRILKKGGLLVVNSPNGESFLAKILKSKWHLVLPPEHLFYFSPKNLTEYLERNGFTLLYSGTIGKRFTFQYIFKMLYKWQKIKIWNYLSEVFSKGLLSKLFIPINLYDNFFVILIKND